MSSFVVRAEDPERTKMTVEADTIEGAVEGAWRMQRHYEAPVVIEDHRDGVRVIGRLNLEWLDG